MRMMQHEDTYPHSHWLASKRPVVRFCPPPPPREGLCDTPDDQEPLTAASPSPPPPYLDTTSRGVVTHLATPAAPSVCRSVCPSRPKEAGTQPKTGYD